MRHVTPRMADINFEWGKDFKLIGINFTNCLSQMNLNFSKKLDDIRKLYKCWLYRDLSPMGKVTIIKSLALSKLSHVVLVTPHLEDGSIKVLIDESFKFLWSGKPDRIKRKVAHLPVAEGGLNMPNIHSFWNSLKCSWIRRMASSKAGWQSILHHTLVEIKSSVVDLWYSGPEEISRLQQQQQHCQ